MKSVDLSRSLRSLLQRSIAHAQQLQRSEDYEAAAVEWTSAARLTRHARRLALSSRKISTASTR